MSDSGILLLIIGRGSTYRYVVRRGFQFRMYGAPCVCTFGLIRSRRLPTADHGACIKPSICVSAQSFSSLASTQAILHEHDVLA